MSTQKAKVFEEVVIPAEPVREQNNIYKMLKLRVAKEYPRKQVKM